jgi:hypothetical protein
MRVVKKVANMNYRQQAFRDKFTDAAGHFGVSWEKIVSLKVRENVGTYHEYKELLDALQGEAGLDHTPVAGNFRGNGHLVGNAKTKVIVVEHETGLEILYVAGAVASIIGLVPLVLRYWRAIRGRFHKPRHHDFHTLETRRIDINGCLIEEQNSGLGLPWADPFDIMSPALLSAAENIDVEIQRLKAAINGLAERMNVVEKKLAERKPRQAAKVRKEKTRKIPKP